MDKSVARLVLSGAAIAVVAAMAATRGRAAGPAAVRFDEIGKKAGVEFRHHTREFKGTSGDVLRMFTSGGASVAVGDFDNDGFDDLFVTDSAEGTRCRLYRNNGNMTFTDVTDKAGVGGGNDPLSIVADAIWFDYDNDG